MARFVIGRFKFFLKLTYLFIIIIGIVYNTSYKVTLRTTCANVSPKPCVHGLGKHSLFCQNPLSFIMCFIMCLIFVTIMNVICCMISNAVLLHNNVSYSHPFEYCNVISTTCNAKIAWINSLSGIMISGLHSYQTLVRNFCEESVNNCFAFKIFRQTTVLKNGMSRTQRQCYCFSNICCSFCAKLSGRRLSIDAHVVTIHYISAFGKTHVSLLKANHDT